MSGYFTVKLFSYLNGTKMDINTHTHVCAHTYIYIYMYTIYYFPKKTYI